MSNFAFVATTLAVDAIESGSSPVCESRPAVADEWGVLKLSALSRTGFDCGENKAYLGDLGTMTNNEVHQGDVLMSRKNTLELVGTVVTVNQVRPRLLLPDLMFRLRLKSDKLLPAYFSSMMMSTAKRSAVRNLSSGSAASMPNISKARLRKLVIEVPDLARQARFAEHVARLDAERNVMVAASAHNDELFTSLQSRAFRGEL